MCFLSWINFTLLDLASSLSTRGNKETRFLQMNNNNFCNFNKHNKCTHCCSWQLKKQFCQRIYTYRYFFCCCSKCKTTVNHHSTLQVPWKVLFKSNPLLLLSTGGDLKAQPVSTLCTEDRFHITETVLKLRPSSCTPKCTYNTLL